MLMLIALLLVAIPAMAILYGVVRGRRMALEGDEGSGANELLRRWDAAVDGLRSAELERSLGSLAEEDYDWIRRHYLQEAAAVMKSLEVEECEEEQLLARIELEVQRVRERVLPPSRLNGHGKDGGQAEASWSTGSQDA